MRQPSKKGAAVGEDRRMDRGGSWDDESGACTAAFRFVRPAADKNGGTGFRVARVPVGFK